MRIMVVRPSPVWAVGDVARGWISGLRLAGVEVVDFRWDKRIAFHADREPKLSPIDVALVAADSLLATVYEAQPDVVMVIVGSDVPPSVFESLRRHGQAVALVHTESPYEDDRQVKMAWAAGIHMVNDPSGVEALRAAGANAWYAPHSYDPTVHFAGSGERDLPFVFVGSGFAGRRMFFEAMRWPPKMRPLIAGHWLWNPEHGVDPLESFYDRSIPAPLDNRRTAALYRRAQMSLNVYRLDHVERPELACGWAMGPREVELAACGTFFLRMPRPEGDMLLPMLPTFDSVEEASDLVAWWAVHPRQRAAAAREATAAVADRTFENVARGFLGQIERRPCVAA